MAVRVKAKITSKESSRSMETSLLLNTGYEALGSRLLLPKRLAEELEIKKGQIHIEARTSLGIGRLTVPGVKALVEVEGKMAEADVRISDAENEAIANDALIELLKIEILRPKEGVYRFSDDPSGKFRKSTSPKFWQLPESLNYVKVF